MGSESYPGWRSRAQAAMTVASLTLVACVGSKEHDEFTGGCEKFGVFSQNRWQPYGTAVRAQPDILAPKLNIIYAPNEEIAVDGWVSTGKLVYPTNQPPWNSDVWFHSANNLHGWVSFAGVRAEPTSPDPTGLADGGQPVQTTPECRGEFIP